MPELTAPDELFDGDLVASDERSLADRSDWIIQDGQIVHAPVVGWTWACSKCGESGTLPEDAVALFCKAYPFGTRHAANPFGTQLPLLISVVRKFPGSAPGAD
ncbi:hypothetical protein ACIQPR_45395 [Streptomyces sp. NPDC091280]|uniref:hypothetical protein n=1 Tax=Streptomyces sp. NPDC091280 TaxID=3365984 RepID=UPI0037F54A7F